MGTDPKLIIKCLTIMIAVSIAIGGSSDLRAQDAPAAIEKKPCDQAGLTLPEGFCATVFADNLGRARQLTVGPNGDVYVNTWSSTYTELKNAPGGYVVVLRDTDRDGKADNIERFGTVHRDGKAGGGTGIAVHGSWLYVEDNGRIVRYRLDSSALVPKGKPDVILSGLWTERGHIMHPFAIAKDGTMYVNSGSITNACQEKDRSLESPGVKGCPELKLHGGIWRYDANKTNQRFSAKERFATGTRNIVAPAVNEKGELYAAFHGRDQLNSWWPKLYTAAQNSELPGEMFSRIEKGDDFGWPFCYYDPQQKKHVLAPEYGGDGGKTQGSVCSSKKLPAFAFPAHWAPNGMTFYYGSSFPAKYRGGAFVVFHGSHDRTPPQAGFLVTFVPFKAAGPAGTYETFADGFSGPGPFTKPTEAPNRPMAPAVGPDGALYISDDVKGRIWRITYAGS